MALVKRVVTRPRRQRESRSDSEGEKKEETQSKSKSNPAADEVKSSSSGSDAEEKAERKKQEIAKGKRPMEAKGVKKPKWDIDDIMSGAAISTKGIVIGEAFKKSETETNTVKPKAKRVRSRRAFAVRSSYSLRTGLKGIGVDVDSVVEPKYADKGKEKVAEVFQDSETESEEACKRIKIERNDDDHDDTDDKDGAGGGTHTNVSSLGVGIVAGK